MSFYLFIEISFHLYIVCKNLVCELGLKKTEHCGHKTKLSFRTIKVTSTSPSTVATMSTSEALMAGNLFRLADPETVGLYTPKKQSGEKS